VDGWTDRYAGAIINYRHDLNFQTFPILLLLKTDVNLVTETQFVATVRVVIPLFFEMTYCYASCILLQYYL